MNRWAAALIALSLGMGTSCIGESPSDNRLPRIAFVMKTLNNPFFVEMSDGANEAAARLGIQLEVEAPEREIDVERQIQIVEGKIDSRVDALCVVPSDAKQLAPILLKANRAGIPVLIVDTRIDEEISAELGVEIAAFIGSDNYLGGFIAGEYLISRFGDETAIAILEGIPGQTPHDARLAGFYGCNSFQRTYSGSCVSARLYGT